MQWSHFEGQLDTFLEGIERGTGMSPSSNLFPVQPSEKVAKGHAAWEREVQDFATNENLCAQAEWQFDCLQAMTSVHEMSQVPPSSCVERLLSRCSTSHTPAN